MKRMSRPQDSAQLRLLSSRSSAGFAGMALQRALLLSLLVLLLLLALPSRGQSLSIALVQTAQNTTDRLTPQANLTFSSTDPGTIFKVSVDATTTHQTILGFGGAFTEASAWVWSQLSPALQQEVLQAYWGPNGHHYAVGRVPINSCDFALAPYNFDNVSGDYDLVNFSIDHDKALMIPFIKAAMNMSVNPIHIYGSPWSPPGWMKGNGDMESSSKPCLIQDPRVFESWALYLSKFISAYEAEGVPIWGLTPQNEPTSQGTWEVCVWTEWEMRDWIRDYLGPRMQQDHPDVKIMIVDDDKIHLWLWTDVILADKNASQYIDGIGFHWYWIFEDFERLALTHDAHPEYFLLATEACSCPGVIIDYWPRGEHYGRDILGDLTHWSVGWVDWNLILDPQGGPNHGQNYCDAQIIGDFANQTLHYQPPFWYMGHFSRFIPPGSVRIDSSSEIYDVLITHGAFLTPEQEVVLVIMNENGFSVDFSIEFGSLYAKSSIPAHGIQTYIWDASADKAPVLLGQE